jgi:hypothetical protein
MLTRTRSITAATLLAIAALLAISGCGGSSERAAGTPQEAESARTPAALAKRLGCESTYVVDSTDEIAVEAVGICTFEGQEIRLLTFANDEARDTFKEVAEQSGSRYVETKQALVEVEGEAVEKAVQARLDG